MCAGQPTKHSVVPRTSGTLEAGIESKNMFRHSSTAGPTITPVVMVFSHDVLEKPLSIALRRK